MPLLKNEIEKLILESIPDATIEIKDLMGDNNHYAATIKSKFSRVYQKLSSTRLYINLLKEKWEISCMLCH